MHQKFFTNTNKAVDPIRGVAMNISMDLSPPKKKIKTKYLMESSLKKLSSISDRDSKIIPENLKNNFNCSLEKSEKKNQRANEPITNIEKLYQTNLIDEAKLCEDLPNNKTLNVSLKSISNMKSKINLNIKRSPRELNRNSLINISSNFNKTITHKNENSNMHRNLCNTQKENLNKPNCYNDSIYKKTESYEIIKNENPDCPNLTPSGILFKNEESQKRSNLKSYEDYEKNLRKKRLEILIEINKRKKNLKFEIPTGFKKSGKKIRKEINTSDKILKYEEESNYILKESKSVNNHLQKPFDYAIPNSKSNKEEHQNLKISCNTNLTFKKSMSMIIQPNEDKNQPQNLPLNEVENDIQISKINKNYLTNIYKESELSLIHTSKPHLKDSLQTMQFFDITKSKKSSVKLIQPIEIKDKTSTISIEENLKYGINENKDFSSAKNIPDIEFTRSKINLEDKINLEHLKTLTTPNIKTSNSKKPTLL